MFFEKLLKLCVEKNTTPNAVCIHLGLSQATQTKWRKGAIPRETTLLKIAEYFDVPVSYFSEAPTQTIHDNHGVIGNTHAPVTINTNTEPPLGEIEKELIAICSKLDTKRKNALLTKAYELLES